MVSAFSWQWPQHWFITTTGRLKQVENLQPRLPASCIHQGKILGRGCNRVIGSLRSINKCRPSSCRCNSVEAEGCDTLAWRKHRGLIRMGCKLHGGHCPAPKDPEGGWSKHVCPSPILHRTQFQKVRSEILTQISEINYFLPTYGPHFSSVFMPV